MSNDMPITPDPVAAGTASGAPATNGQQVDWQAKAQEWQNRFTGLQGRLQKEVNAKAEIEAQLQELRDQMTGLSGQRDELDVKYKSLSEQHSATATEAAIAKAQAERLKLVAKEYGDLLPLELEGLLPDGTGDDLKKKLDAFRTTIQAQMQKAQTQMAAGATPSAAPPAAAAAQGAQQLQQQAIQALREGKTADYDRLMTEFFKTQKQGA